MNTLQLVLAILGTLSQVVTNKALGLNDTGTKVANILALVSLLGQEGEKANDGLIALNDQIKALDAAGGPIPDAVWDQWTARHEAAKARLAAA